MIRYGAIVGFGATMLSVAILVGDFANFASGSYSDAYRFILLGFYVVYALLIAAFFVGLTMFGLKVGSAALSFAAALTAVAYIYLGLPFRLPITAVSIISDMLVGIVGVSLLTLRAGYGNAALRAAACAIGFACLSIFLEIFLPNFSGAADLVFACFLFFGSILLFRAS